MKEKINQLILDIQLDEMINNKYTFINYNGLRRDRFKQLTKNFDEERMDILLALKPKNQFFGYEGNGDFNLNTQTGELQKVADPNHTYIGAQIFHPRILKAKTLENPAEKCFSLSYFFKKSQGENGVLNRVRGIEIQEEVFHIGTVKTLSELSSIIN